MTNLNINRLQPVSLSVYARAKLPFFTQQIDHAGGTVRGAGTTVELSSFEVVASSTLDSLYRTAVKEEGELNTHEWAVSAQAIWPSALHTTCISYQLAH